MATKKINFFSEREIEDRDRLLIRESFKNYELIFTHSSNFHYWGDYFVTNASNDILTKPEIKFIVEKYYSNIFRINYGAIPYPTRLARTLALSPREIIRWNKNVFIKKRLKQFSLQNIYDYGSKNGTNWNIRNFDRLRAQMYKVSSQPKLCTFIDQAIPNHPDNDYRGWLIDEHEYYNNLNLLFRKLRKTGFKVVFASHPIGSLKRVQQRLECDHFVASSTHEYIAKSELVISIFSTAITFAAILKKKILLYNPIRQTTPFVDAFSRSLEVPYFTEKKLSEIDDWLPILPGNYETYLREYT